MEGTMRVNLPISRVPYPDTSIQTAGRYSDTVKGNSIDLTEMTLQRAQALSCRDTPDFGGGVITSRNYQIAMYL